MIHRSGRKRLGLIWLLLALILSATPSQAQQGEIAIGDTVEVVTSGSNLNLRQKVGLDQPVVAKLPPGTLMTVVDGPKSADGLTWWKLEGPLGKGWAAANYLRPVTGTPITGDGGTPDEKCERLDQAYPGIGHCTRDGGQTHVILIDLDDPHVRFEMVMAGDETSVKTTTTEWVSQMAERLHGSAAVINGDYFGENHHGPEGLTIHKGERIDGPQKPNNGHGAVNRSALVISKPVLDEGSSPINAEVVRLQPEEDQQSLDSDRFYNTVGGGPQVMFDGVWSWVRGQNHPNYRDCLLNPGDPPIIDDDIINGECFRNTGEWDYMEKTWTAVGIKEDGDMIWVVTPYKNVKSTMDEFNVKTAIKLDGGGSSQLWFHGEPIVHGNRAVPNGLLVFYIRSTEVVERPLWPIVIENEDLTVRLILKNNGADTWNKGEYKLRKEDKYTIIPILPKKNLLEEAEGISLPHDVKPGETVTIQWQAGPFSTVGINTTVWRMYQNNDPFPGEPVKISVVVLPEKLREKKEELEKRIREWIDQGLEDIQGLIIKWIEDEMTSCFRSIGLPIMGVIGLIVNRHRMGRKVRYQIKE